MLPLCLTTPSEPEYSGPLGSLEKPKIAAPYMRSVCFDIIQYVLSINTSIINFREG